MGAGVFKGLSKAKVTVRGKYLSPGFVGDVEITETLVKETTRSGTGFIVNFDIVSSNLEEHPVGSSASWFVKMQDKNVAFSNILAFMGALAGLSDAEEIEESASDLEKLLDEAVENPTDNDLIGDRLHVETTLLKTKKGDDFTRYDWSPKTED